MSQASLLTKLAGPMQKKLKKATTPVLKKLQSAVAAVSSDGSSPSMSPLVVATATAALCWLLPACAYTRWYRPLEDSPEAFAGLIAFTAHLRSRTGVAEASAFEGHWLKPSVLPRAGAMAIGPMQHASMRWWIKLVVKQAQSVSADLQAALEGGAGRVSAATVARLAETAQQLHWFSELMTSHSVMEDELIYPDIEKAMPGSTAVPVADHAHEVPIFAATSATLNKAAAALKELLGEGDAVELTEEQAAAAKAGAAAAGEAAAGTTEDAAIDAGEAVALALKGIDGEHGVVALGPGVEKHFVGEETHIFPNMQKLAPPKRKAMFLKTFDLCKEMHSTLLAFIIGGLNPAQAEQYLWILRKHAPLTDDEWRARIAELRDGAAEGKMSAEKFNLVHARADAVRSFAEPLEA
jgi:hypothetical protein